MLTSVNKKEKVLSSNLWLLFIMLNLIIAAFIGCSSGGGGGGDDGPGNPTQATASDINLSDDQLLFGGVVIDHISDQTITIQNTGSSNLKIGQIAQSNPLSPPFSISGDNCSGSTLAPFKKCIFQVRFSPISQNSFNDSFDIPSNDPKVSSMTMRVNGDGRALNVSINQIDTDDCPQVTLYITVTDKNDDPQLGLTQNDFSLFENDELKAITSFLDKVTSPVSVALALDYSSSTIIATPDIEAGAKDFIDQLDTDNNDEAAIIKFAEEIFVVQTFTTNKDDLKASIDAQFPGARNGTKLYDSIWQAIDEAANAQNDRRAAVVLSDGQDTQSVNNIYEVIDHANEKGVPVFTIGLGYVNVEIMQYIADETGGQYFLAPTSNDLQDIYVLISEILANQYVIKYNSSSSGGGNIILDVEVDFNNLQGEDSKSLQGCP